MKKLAIFIAALLLFSAAAFAQGKPKIAVYVKGGISEEVKAAFRNELLFTLVKSKRYYAVYDNDAFVAAVKRETERYGAGDLNDMQIGKAGYSVNADFVCVASVSPVLGSYQVLARVINVKNEAVVEMGRGTGAIASAADVARITGEIVESMFGVTGEAAPQIQAVVPTPQVMPAVTPPPTYTPAPPMETPTPLPKGPVKAAVYVTGIPPMVAKPFNSAISDALIKSRVYAGIESIDVNGPPSVPALAAAGRNAGVSYIFAINVTGQISVAIIDVAGSMELAKITIDGKITAVSAVVIAKKIVDFILTSGPKPDPGMQVVEEAAPVQPGYKTKYVWVNEPDGKPRILKKRISVEAGAFSPSAYYPERNHVYGYPGPVVYVYKHDFGLGGGPYLRIDLIYAEIIYDVGFSIMPWYGDAGGMAGIFAKYPFVYKTILVSPVVGFGMIGESFFFVGPLTFGGRIDVGISEIAYLRSEYLYGYDIYNTGSNVGNGSSFKIGGGLDVGLGERKRIFLRSELMYHVIVGFLDDSWRWRYIEGEEKTKVTTHSLELRAGIGYKWGGDTRHEIQVPDKKWLSAGTGGFGGGYSAGWYMFFDVTYFEAYFGVLGDGVTTGAFAKLPFGSDVVKFFPLAGFDYNGWAGKAFGVLGAGVDINVYQDAYVRSEFMYNLGKFNFATFRGGAGYRF